MGEIEDGILDRSGQLTGVVADAGGFLDPGDKHVMLQREDTGLVPADDESSALIARRSEERLEEMDGVAERWWN